jgi:hypothetical protein
MEQPKREIAKTRLSMFHRVPPGKRFSRRTVAGTMPVHLRGSGDGAAGQPAENQNIAAATVCTT